MAPPPWNVGKRPRNDIIGPDTSPLTSELSPSYTLRPFQFQRVEASKWLGWRTHTWPPQRDSLSRHIYVGSSSLVDAPQEIGTWFASGRMCSFICSIVVFIPRSEAAILSLSLSLSMCAAKEGGRRHSPRGVIRARRLQWYSSVLVMNLPNNFTS